MKLQVVFLLFAFSGLTAMVTSQDLEVYCGRRLSLALALLCDYKLIKRSEPHYTPAQSLDVAWPWIEPHRAHSMGRSKRNVVSECCEKPCTVKELVSYCGI